MEEGASMVKRSQNGREKEAFNCELFRQQITAFLFRDLPANTELLMKQHRNSCAACREALERAIPIDCMHVFQHISSYVDDEVPADLRARMEAHFKECKHCVAVLDGTRNIVRLVGDEKTFDVPPGFSDRLYRKIPKKRH
jgi:hypothetical protein